MNAFLKWNIASTTIVGLKPHKFRNKFITNLHKIYCDCLLTIFTIFYLTQCYEIYILIHEDVLALVDNLGVSLIYTSTLMKVLVFRSKRMDDLLIMICNLETPILNNYGDNCKSIYWHYVNYNNKIIKICVFFAVITQFPYYITAALEDAFHRQDELFNVINGTVVYNVRPLPVSSWMPFDKYKYYYLTYIWQCFSITIGSAFVYATDVFMYTLLIFAAMPLKVLQYRFKALAEISKFSKGPIVSSDDVLVEDALGDCVKFHQQIIKFVLVLKI